MTYFSRDPEPGPEELVAYVDGRLDARTRRRVERWLAAHPEAAATVEEHQQVLQACRDEPVPEPTAAQWEATFASVAARVPLPTSAKPPRPRLGRRIASLAVAAAAALLLTALPGERAPRPPVALPLVEEVVIPIPVADANDVEIVSIDAADVKVLLVGTPPLTGPLVLASGGDVEIHFAESAQSSWVPAMEEVEGATPIFMVPMRNGEKP